MLGIIASNFLKIGNGSAIVEKYAPTVVLVEAHFFPHFLENFRSHSNASSTLILSRKKKRKWVNTNMRDKLLHIPNERLEGPESFLLVFLCTYKHGFLFLHI